MSEHALSRPAPTSISLKLLASTLDKGGDDPQQGSALCQLPESLRSRIWRYTFIAEDVPIASRPSEPLLYHYSQQSRPRIHTAVLQACRATYREACPYIIALNSAHGAAEHMGSRIPPGVLALHSDIHNDITPWQFATLSSLVIHTDRGSLEGMGSGPGIVAQYGTSWLLAAERHHGVFVAGNDEPYQSSAWERYGKHHSTHEIDDPRNRYRTRLWNDNSLSESYSLNMGDMSLFVDNDAISPYYQAERITNLTIRIDRQEWFPESQDGDKRPRLALDPSFSCALAGESAAGKMQQAAQERRTRQDRNQPGLPYPQHCWGRDIACFPSLNRLTLHLEVFAEDVDELVHVVDCAKLWTFPLGDENPPDERLGRRSPLKWNGRIEEYRWGQENMSRPADSSCDSLCARSGFEVRIISYQL